MSLKTVPVRILLTYTDSTPVFNAKVDATLSGYELDSGVVVPTKVTGRTDRQGEVVLDLWPNARGSGASSYRIEASHGAVLLDTTIVVPDTQDGLPVALQDIINAAPYPALDASQQALIVVQAAVVDAGAQAQLAALAAAAAAESLEEVEAFAGTAASDLQAAVVDTLETAAAAAATTLANSEAAAATTLANAESLVLTVSAAYVSSINNIQELRTLFLNYIASHP